LIQRYVVACDCTKSGQPSTHSVCKILSFTSYTKGASSHRISRSDSKGLYLVSHDLLMFSNMLIHNHYYYFIVLSTYPFLLCFLTLCSSSLFHFSNQLSLRLCHVFLNGRNTCVCVCVFIARQPLVSLGFRTVDVSRSHSIRHSTLSQRVLPDNTQNS
jgi:hypothetical protein